MYNKEAHEKALEKAYKFVFDNIGPEVPDDRFFLVTCTEAVLYGLQDMQPIEVNRFTTMVYGLGAGFGYTGLVCGAVSGAILAIGMDVAARVADPIEARRHIMLSTQKFIKKVEAQFGTTLCRELTGLNLTGEEFVNRPGSRGEFEAVNYNASVCNDIINMATLNPLPSEEGVIPSTVLDPLPPDKPFSTR